MKIRYGIAQSGKFILLDENLARLKNTVFFMPALSENQIREYTEDEIEQAWDGQWYEKGHAPKKPKELLASEVREKRDRLLQETVDVALRSSLYAGQFPSPELIAYRQALLDVPQQPGFPENITWPERPEAGEALPGREEPGTETELHPEK